MWSAGSFAKNHAAQHRDIKAIMRKEQQSDPSLIDELIRKAEQDLEALFHIDKDKLIQASDISPIYQYRDLQNHHQINELIEKAKSEYASDQIARMLAANLLSSGAQLPGKLGEFAAHRLRNPTSGPKKKRGANPVPKNLRDGILAFSVFRLSNSGLSPTKNESSTNKISACDIVVKAYNILAKEKRKQEIKYETVKHAFVNAKKSGLLDHWKKHNSSQIYQS